MRGCRETGVEALKAGWSAVSDSGGCVGIGLVALVAMKTRIRG